MTIVMGSEKYVPVNGSNHPVLKGNQKMVRFRVTVKYVDTDGLEKHCCIVTVAKTKEEAKSRAVSFFFRPDEMSMVKSVEVVGE